MEKNHIFPLEDTKSTIRLCNRCTRAAVFNNYCKYCWSQYSKEKRKPKLVMLIDGYSTKVLDYNNAARFLGITKNYLYVALSKGLTVKNHKLKKC